jgi:hypothetical protein
MLTRVNSKKDMSTWSGTSSTGLWLKARMDGHGKEEEILEWLLIIVILKLLHTLVVDS